MKTIIDLVIHHKNNSTTNNNRTIVSSRLIPKRKKKKQISFVFFFLIFVVVGVVAVVIVLTVTTTQLFQQQPLVQQHLLLLQSFTAATTTTISNNKLIFQTPTTFTISNSIITFMKQQRLFVVSAFSHNPVKIKRTSSIICYYHHYHHHYPPPIFQKNAGVAVVVKNQCNQKKIQRNLLLSSVSSLQVPLRTTTILYNQLGSAQSFSSSSNNDPTPSKRDSKNMNRNPKEEYDNGADDNKSHHNNNNNQQQQQQQQLYDSFVSYLIQTKQIVKEMTTNRKKTTTTTVLEKDEVCVLPPPQLSSSSSSSPPPTIVIGNEAGDADSIISAITLAYVLSMMNKKRPPSEHMQQELFHLPIVSISCHDLQTQRPETLLLLQFAGISPVEHLLYVPDLHDILRMNNNHNHTTTTTTTPHLYVTLVDHNQLNEKSVLASSQLLPFVVNYQVNAIYDHHQDLGQDLDTCSNDPSPTRRRIIEYDTIEKKALVASTCTLVVELLQQEQQNATYPPELSILLLGVILLDSINMNPMYGKCTNRDINAVQHLLYDTDWDSLKQQLHPKYSSLFIETTIPISSLSSTTETIIEKKVIIPDTNQLFQLLQESKFDKQFWFSLSNRDRLRLDYKNFMCDSPLLLLSLKKDSFGISTVLMSFHDFIEKKIPKSSDDDSNDDYTVAILDYMNEMHIDFFAIMFAYTNPKNHTIDTNRSTSTSTTSTSTTTSGKLVRQLMLCSTTDFPMNEMVSYLLTDSGNTLQLKEMDTITTPTTSIQCHVFEQGTVEASRKQVAPLLTQYFLKN